jgi:hypothetical protein
MSFSVPDPPESSTQEPNERRIKIQIKGYDFIDIEIDWVMSKIGKHITAEKSKEYRLTNQIHLGG